MKLKQLSASIASCLVIASGGLSLITVTAPVPAQAQSAGQGVQTLRGCFINSPFTAKIAFNPTNIRQSPSTSAPIVGRFTQVGQIVNFSGITTGTAVPDAWDGVLDNMWYKLGDGTWVSGAVVSGYPNRGNCYPPSTQGKAETFFKWAVGRTGIARYDLGSGYNGQCVTLVARYLQDVYYRDQRALFLGNGRSVANSVASQNPGQFQFKTSGTPKRGAIISFLGGGYDGTYGHVGIVLETNGTSFKMLESNHDGRAQQSVVRISDWRGRSGVVGWADPIGNLP